MCPACHLGGEQAGEQTVKTAGKPRRLNLDVWTQHGNTSPLPLTGNGTASLKADGTDLAFVTVSLVDKDGTLIPQAADQLRFSVSGAATFRAACNGDATSLEPFTEPTMKLFSGQLVVVLQAAKKAGNAVLTVYDDERHLKQSVTIKVQ